MLKMTKQNNSFLKCSDRKNDGSNKEMKEAFQKK
jgi:hypothetical protein